MDVDVRNYLIKKLYLSCRKIIEKCKNIKRHCICDMSGTLCSMDLLTLAEIMYMIG